MNHITRTVDAHNKQYEQYEQKKLEQSIPVTSFSELTQSAIWGARLNINAQITATHQELAILRHCANQALSKPGQVIHVIHPNNSQRVNYLVRTLMHFGISCGQIIARGTSEIDNDPEGVWLFVEERNQAA